MRAQAGLRYDYTARDPLAGYAPDNFLTPVDTFHPGRFRLAAGTGTAAYLAFGTGLWAIWYKDYERSGFQTFDDWGEWLQMDKAGHVFTAYFFARNAFAGSRWAGMRRPAARYTALGVANLLQGTIEVMDGYSENWGFSWTDMGANLAGSLIFVAQDMAWQEQRILVKVSHDLRSHPDVPISNRDGGTSNLGYVTRQRFGEGIFERYLKDYNAQTIWLSVNPASFAPRSRLPQWLNVAIGYGAEDVYGAYFNSWTGADGDRYAYRVPRYRQLFLSPDIYFSRIPTRKRWVRMVLGILDFMKMPAPAVEYGNGRLRLHWLR